MNTAEQALVALAGRQHGLVSRGQALGAGLSAGAIYRRLVGGDWTSVFKGVYRLAGSEPTWPQTVMASCLAAGTDAVASHRAAATLHNMPGVPRWVEITVPRPRQVTIEGIRAHRTRRLPPADIETVSLVPVTTAGRTIEDLSGPFSKARLGRLLDYSLANQLVTRAEMEARASGRTHDDTLVQLLDERPSTPRPMGSEFESALYQALRVAGLPLPQAQYRVLMPDGLPVYLDFAYPEIKLAIEADSYLWHSTPEAWRRDRGRNNELVALGWSFLPLTYYLVVNQPAEVARLVRGARAARS